jgi:hypothetical protein
MSESNDAAADRIEATKLIGAPASRIFQLICDPQGQVAIDGSKMLVAATDGQPVAAVGDTFTMYMDRSPVGPAVNYSMVNTVIVYDADRELAWNPAGEGRSALGHVYGFSLEPLGPDQTRVTNYCDWSAISDAARERVAWPVVSVEMLAQSLENLDRAVR